MPYTPELCGDTERENLTIVKAARSMIHINRLLESLWAEAVKTATYVITNLPKSYGSVGKLLLVI